MEDCAFKFILRGQVCHLAAIKPLAQGLCNEEYGALLEEKAEEIGDEAEKLVAELLDAWEEQHGHAWFENYSETEDSICFFATGGNSLFDEVELLKRLFAVTGASVEVIDYGMYDSDDD